MKTLAVFGALFLGVLTAVAVTADSNSPFSSYVDEGGAISVPKDYRTKWTFLGSWSIATKDGEPRGAAGGAGGGRHRLRGGIVGFGFMTEAEMGALQEDR